jgi:Domain of unknown function (DUF1917)
MFGSSAKVATMHLNMNARNNDERVICVYSYDSNDKEDLLRILRHLRMIGINSIAFYKEYEETYVGNYASTCERSQTNYYTRPGNGKLLTPRSRR